MRVGRTKRIMAGSITWIQDEPDTARVLILKINIRQSSFSAKEHAKAERIFSNS
jgi:hypothetical protein